MRLRLYHTRKNAAAAVWRDKLIVTGGENANGPQAFAEVYDLGANGATLLANYKVEGLEAVASHSAEVWEDKLYLIGGYGSEGQTSPNSHIVSFELKDTSAKSLGTTSFTNLTTSRYGHASTIMRGTLYIMGGSSGNADLNSVEGYQLLAEGPSKLNSNQVPNLLTARKEHAAVTYGDKIVLAGGSQGGFNNTTPIYSNAIEVLQLVPSNLNSNLVIRNHPSFGAEDLSLARAGLKAEMVSDLMVNTGGLGIQYPASTLEVLKFTGNNAQQALASANGSALLTFTLKRLKPTAIISTPTVSGTGGVLTICFDITDPTGVPATISLEVSENGGDTWSTASPIEGLGIDLSAVETGTNRCLTWDTGVSYPGNYRDMVVRIKASDGSVSPASNLFDIINSPAYVKQLPVVSNLTRGNSDRGSIDFTYDIEDGNGDSSAIEIFYFDGLELQPIEVLEDVSPGTGRIYTWNSSTYESTYLSSTYLLMLPTDSVVGEEGTSDQTQLFSLNNGQLSFDTISVTAGCNGTVMVVTNSKYYECGNTTNSTAFFALDASSAINDNEGEGINFNWQLKEELAGATLENFDSALATLTITDDGIVTASNVERVIEIVASASQAGIGGKTLEVSSQLILRKPPVSANAAIIGSSCDGLISTSNSISCTGNTARITLDGSNSINPNNGGTYIVWNSTPSATGITSIPLCHI